MNRFVNAVGNDTLTENGAVTFKSTLNANLDFYSTAGALRLSNSLERGVSLFQKAYKEDKITALRNLFHLRDIRGGKGERELFRMILRWLAKHDVTSFKDVIEYVAFYGRWDDLLEFHTFKSVVDLVSAQLDSDMGTDKPSLLGKWMPSENAGKESKVLALEWIRILGVSARAYRLSLTSLRTKIGIVETFMSSKNWKDIKYQNVPARAMKQYRKAFGIRDSERFTAYLESVNKGETKINAMGLFPYELIKNANDPVIQAQWNALPDYIPEGKSFLPMADVSGSMSGTPMEVSTSLAIYGSERNKTAFKDLVLTFTNHPTLHKLSGTLAQKYQSVMSNVGYDTNIQAAFQAILTHAKRYNVPQSDMPDYLLVITDMEFNDSHIKGTSITALKAVKEMYKSAGYTAPIIVFWNVNSRQANVGALDNDRGVILVSGLSAAVFKSALAGNPLAEITPVEAMLETLNSERYNMIGV